MAEGYFRQQIPACPGYGFETTPEFSTRVKELANGAESRNGLWMYGRHRVALSWMNISRPEYEKLRGFFYGFRGRLYAFLQRDWADYEAFDEIVGVGDGVVSDFRLGKFYTDGAGYFRPIYAIDEEKFTLYLNDIPVDPTLYTLDADRGIVSFTSPPEVDQVVSWSGEFFLWARFDSDNLPVQIVDASNGEYVFSGATTILEVGPPPLGV